MGTMNLSQRLITMPISLGRIPILLVLCAASACSLEHYDDTQTESAEFALLPPFECGSAGSDPDFYSYDGDLPPDNGAILKCEELQAAGDAGDTDGGVTGYRVLYRTTVLTRTGNTTSTLAVPASGTVFVPNAEVEANNAGITTRPVIANTHGLTGVIASCAPSFSAQYDKGRIEQAAAQLSVEPVVVVPDYVGLGVDPKLRVVEKDYQVTWPNGVKSTPFSNISHPMVSIEGEGRATIDLVRAVRQIAKARVAHNPKFLTLGQSQGGHAAIATAEVMASGYGDGTTLVGVVAGAPATELDKNAWWNADFRNSLFGMITASLPLEWRDLRASELLTANGEMAISNTTNRMCWNGSTLLETLATYNIVDLFQSDPFQNPAVKLALSANSPGRRPVNVPMFVGTVRGDPLIDHRRTATFVNSSVYKNAITFCEYYGGTAKNNFEQTWYMNLHWTLRALDHDAFAKMFGNPSYKIGCTNAAQGATPAEFVKRRLEPTSP